MLLISDFHPGSCWCIADLHIPDYFATSYFGEENKDSERKKNKNSMRVECSENVALFALNVRFQ